jgi:hypothetical protein
MDKLGFGSASWRRSRKWFQLQAGPQPFQIFDSSSICVTLVRMNRQHTGAEHFNAGAAHLMAPLEARVASAERGSDDRRD